MIAGDNQGILHSSFPLDKDGNYKYWAFSDPYKFTVMKNDGSEVEDDIYEAYNISLLLAGQKGNIAEGHGVRLGGEKYMHLKVRGGGSRSDASQGRSARQRSFSRRSARQRSLRAPKVVFSLR